MQLSYIAEENLKGIILEAKRSKGTEKELFEEIMKIWHPGKKKDKAKETEKEITKDEKRGTPP